VIAKAILGYLGDTMEGGVHKAPVRVVVLGNRGAGKTSLIQALSGNRYYYLNFRCDTHFNCYLRCREFAGPKAGGDVSSCAYVPSLIRSPATAHQGLSLTFFDIPSR
jgi:hypothetical protein